MKLATRQNPDTQHSDDSDVIDLGILLNTVWVAKWRIAAFVAVAGVIGLSYAMLTPPTYQADALIQLEAKKAGLALPAALSDMMDSNPVTVTEIEIIRSRMVVGQAVAELHLDWKVTPRKVPLIGSALAAYSLPIPEFGFLAPYSRLGESIRLDFLQVPPAWVGREILLTVMQDAGFQLDLPNGAIVKGRVGETLEDTGLGYSIRIGAVDAAPQGRQFTLVQQSEEQSIGELERALTVTELGRQSGILELRLTSPNRYDARRILDAVTKAYLNQNVERSSAEAESSLAFVEQQLPEAESAVAKAEKELNDYRQKQQSVDLSLETQALLTQVTALEGELRALDGQEIELKQKYTKSHPLYQELLANRANIQERLDKLRIETDDLPKTQREIVNLTQNLDLARTIYVELRSRSQELKVMRASSIGNVRIIDAAQTALAPIAPRKTIILTGFLILGAFMGTGYVFVSNWLRRGLTNPEDLEKVGLPVFATINVSKEGRVDRHGKDFVEILAIKNPTDLTVEGFRSLRTSLHFAMLDAKTRSVAITSTAPEAGKSFTCANLAVVAAQAGQKVCLVDADLRRGRLRRYFNVQKNAPGLADLLSGMATLDEVLVEGPIPGVWFVPTGRFPPNPSELLMRVEFTTLIDALNARFDLTLIDTPAVLAVTDAAVIARAAGTTIAVVRYDVTPMGEVLAMQRLLETTGGHLSGAIFNGFDPTKARAYSYSYRYDYRKAGEPTDD